MTDLKLFRIDTAGVNEVKGTSVPVDKSFQDLIEKHLHDFLGVRFLVSDYRTDAGRIDILAIDKDHCPVIITFKRTSNDNIVNQGAVYLDWLLDHKDDFNALVLEKLGQQAADNIDWSAPRLLCIAGNFSRQEAQAMEEIRRNIELIRYRQFENDHILFDLVCGQAVC